MVFQSELDTLTSTLKQLENQKGEAQKRLDDLKAQVSKEIISSNCMGFYFFNYYFTQKIYSKKKIKLSPKTFMLSKYTQNKTNLKQEDVDKSVIELHEELNEAKEKVCK